MRNEYYQSVITTAIYIAIFASNIYKRGKELDDNIFEKNSVSLPNVYDLTRIEMPSVGVFVEINMGIYYF